MKKIVISIVAVIAAGFVFFGVYRFIDDNIGVSGSKIEEDIRTSQLIDANWNVEGTVSDTMAAYISYPDDKSQSVFSVYTKDTSSLSYGYFFNAGGGLGDVDGSIYEAIVNGCNERGFISMNKPKAAKVIVKKGKAVKEIELDPEEPFAIVLPLKCKVTFYDKDGNTVDYHLNDPEQGTDF